MSKIQRLGEWIIDWEYQLAYKLSYSEDSSNPLYLRYSRITGQEDEVYESELPARIRTFIDINL